jgi:hypothetical protein
MTAQASGLRVRPAGRATCEAIRRERRLDGALPAHPHTRAPWS